MVRPRSSLPHTMKPVSTAQMAIDAASRVGGRVGLASTSLGNSVDYLIPVGGGPMVERELVRCDSHDLYKDQNPNDGKNWILTGGLAIDHPNPLIGLGRSGRVRIRIQFGSGGILQEAIVTALPQFKIDIPSTTVKITVFSVGDVQEGHYVITGALHRGMPDSSGSKLFTVQEDTDASQSVVGNAILPVPAFARSVQTLGNSGNPLYVTVGGTMSFEPSSLSYTSAELLALKNLAQPIEVPAGTSVLVFNGYGASFGAQAPILSWDIDL